MAIIFACECRRPITVPDTAAGRRKRCPVCCTMVLVPMDSDPRMTAALEAAKTRLTASLRIGPPTSARTAPASR
jgi:hypothetical protein